VACFLFTSGGLSNLMLLTFNFFNINIDIQARNVCHLLHGVNFANKILTVSVAFIIALIIIVNIDLLELEK
jgi:hypothetical protein